MELQLLLLYGFKDECWKCALYFTEEGFVDWSDAVVCVRMWSHGLESIVRLAEECPMRRGQL